MVIKKSTQREPKHIREKTNIQEKRNIKTVNMLKVGDKVNTHLGIGYITKFLDVPNKPQIAIIHAEWYYNGEKKGPIPYSIWSTYVKDLKKVD
jgi:hypothetical protein